MEITSHVSPNLLSVLAFSLFCAALISSTAAEEPLMSVYEKWMGEFGRVYKSSAEKLERFEVFKANYHFIESMKSQPDLTYTVGLNEFADLTNEEFVAKYAGFKSASAPKKLPLSSSCWSFSVTGAIEGINKIKTGTLLSLSEQELVDCDTSNSGCNGGYMDYAFQWVIYNGGITTESDYPYTSGSSGKAGTCNYPKTYDYAVSLYSYQDVTTNCESCLKNAVANQPITVGIEGSGSGFQFYSGGIFTGPCGTSLDHAVLVVGYGPCSTGTAYWIVKNQWGTSWGESGYMRIQRNIASTKGLCGIAMEPSYPIM